MFSLHLPEDPSRIAQARCGLRCLGHTLDIQQCAVFPGVRLGPMQLPAVREHLLAWVRKVAPTLGTTVPIHFASEVPIGVGFRVSLYRQPARRSRKRLRFAYAMPEDLAQEQRERVLKAIRKKVPKLWRWRVKGAVAIIAAETRDITLLDERLVAELFDSELQSSGVDLDPLFRLFIIDTSGCQWSVYSVLHRTEQQDQTCIEEMGNFDESALIEVG